MKRYSAAAARARMADLLDDVQRGERVVIERRGVQFSVLARVPRRAGRRRGLIAHVDPALEAGTWSWHWNRGRIEFRGRRATRRT